jgi:hypothetical protein
MTQLHLTSIGLPDLQDAHPESKIRARVEDVGSMSLKQPPIYEEVYRFLVSSPTPEQIIHFQASYEVRERVRHLLDASERGVLSVEERAELDEFERINHLVSMLKIYARQRLAGNS